jgi:acyl-CoA synthetase (AMP-forming)/AMP-acid ligase II
LQDGRPNVATLVELLHWQARARPNCLAFRFLSEGETEAEALTFSELDRRAREVAAMLRKQSAPGSRACLFFPPGPDYIAALFGTLYAGMIAVPAYPPRSRNRLERLEILIDEPAQMVALTTTKVMERWRPSLARAPQRLKD